MGRWDFHPTWNHLIDTLIPKVSRRYGGEVYDPRAGKTWDPGQAVCAELYGPDWFHTKQFKADNDIPPDQPCPPEILEAATRLGESDCGWANRYEDEGV